MVRTRYVLVGLFLFSLLLRALFFQGFLSKQDNYMVPEDSAQYHAAALSLMTGDKITTHAWAGPLHRLPGYPLFLAGCYQLFGIDKKAALWVQVVLASFIPVFVYLLSLVLFPGSHLLALLSGLCIAVHVGFLTYAGSLMSESLFMLLLLGFLIIFLQSFRLWFSTHAGVFNTKKFFAAGVLLGLVSIVRPVGVPLLVLSLCFLLCAAFTLRQKIQAMGVFVCGWLLMVFWILLRNYLLCGALFFHTLPGIHFLRYSTASMYKEIHKCSFSDSRNALASQWHGRIQVQGDVGGKVLNEYERCRVAETITRDYFYKHPIIMIKHFMINIIKTLCGLHASYLQFVDTKELYEHNTSWGVWERVKVYIPPRVKSGFLVPIIYLEILMLGLMLIGSFYFCIRACFNRLLFEKACLMVPWTALFIVLTLGAGCARLRLPADPLLMIMALVGFTLISYREVKP